MWVSQPKLAGLDKDQIRTGLGPDQGQNWIKLRLGQEQGKIRGAFPQNHCPTTVVTT